jgi:hypothetical protein
MESYDHCLSSFIWNKAIYGTTAIIRRNRHKNAFERIAGIRNKGFDYGTVISTKPITVKYELTSYGRSLKPIIDEMALWGEQHRQKISDEISKKVTKTKNI